MAKYKISGDGVKDTETGACIPNTPGNRHWAEYQAWLAEGNTPDPEYTQAQLDQAEKDERQSARISQLQGALVDQFEMIMALFQVGKDKGVWTNSDFPAELRAKAAEWNQLIADYRSES